MCGISGIYKLNGSSVDPMQLRSMTDRIQHRGPDGFGYWYDPDNNICLGHRRLAILDLTENGRQPMEFLGLTITFNGEIYNYLELKEYLGYQGYQFKTNTDTEVLLALYHYLGKDCVNELDGMFSFAIWDSSKRELFCARDRFGEKPFYFTSDTTSFTFASEIKQFFELGVSREINREVLYRYCTHDTLNNPTNMWDTFFKNIKQLPPGHSVTVKRDGSMKIDKYWDLDYQNQANQNLSLGEAAEQFNELLRISVTRRLRSDVTVGTSLSGGLDSTSIAGQICRLDGVYGLNTFTASFPGYEKDETQFIGLFKKRYPGISDHYVTPTPDELYSDLNKLFFHQDEPIGSTSIYAQYRVMQLAKQQNVTVLLDGQGADEYLGGYNQCWPVRLRELYRRNRQQYRSEKKKLKELLGFEQKIGINLAVMLLYPAFHSKLSKIWKLLHKKQLAEINPPLKSDFFNGSDILTSDVNWSDLNHVLYHSLLHSGLQDLLRFADRNSMAHSREVRLPFLYHKLVEFSFSLPSSLKMNDGWSKLVLRSSQDKFLPTEICWRKEKIGFATPQATWLSSKVIQPVISEARRKVEQSKIFNERFLETASPWKLINLSYLVK
jgi:asparagine synthase (glutamine-hydrolysing)